MRQFENGEEVEAKIGNWHKAEYVGLTQGKHCVRLIKGGFASITVSDIRPVQLICDEARDVIKDALNSEIDIKFKFDSDLIFMEYLKSDLRENNILPSAGWQITARSNGVCIENGVTKYVTKINENLPELNLKTGEVVPCEEEKVPPLADHQLQKLIDAESQVDVLKSQLKQKSESFDIMVDSKNKVISNLDNQLKDTNDLCDQLKEKDAEIERLNKLLGSFENLLSLRSIIYELVNTPYGHTFDISQKEILGHDFDIKVRKPVAQQN